MMISFILANTVSLYGNGFPFFPNKEISLDPRLIYSHHPVTTQDPKAQQFFDQGLTLIYAFNHDAAYWSFQKASQLDPKMAMAYWGMALALGANINMNITPEREKVAYELIQKALKLTNNISEYEQDYIQALSQRYTSDPSRDLHQLAINYQKAMKKLSKKYRDDPDAAVLYAESSMNLNPWNLWDVEGNPLEETLEIIKLLESVLKRQPNHLGANHYYIHAVEGSSFPERALINAERLRKMLPASGHILHMPSHIYLLTGDYHQAAKSNEEAIAVDREYIKKYGMEGIYPLHYLSHNLYFLTRAYSMEGRFNDAKRTAEELETFYAPYFQMMPDLEYYIPTKMFVLLRFHRWKEILKLPEPQPEMKVSRVLWNFARAMALASLGEEQLALKEQTIFLERKSLLPSDAIYGYNKANKITKIAEYLLESKIAEIHHNFLIAIDSLKTAVAAQDLLKYNEPPDWFFSVRESLGAILLKNERYQEAEQIFREDLTKHPRNGCSLFGLSESLKAQSRIFDAYWVEREFQEAWKYSDAPLTISDL